MDVTIQNNSQDTSTKDLISSEKYQRPGFKRIIEEAVSIGHLIPKVIAAQARSIPFFEDTYHLRDATFAMPGVGAPGCSLDELVASLRDVGINARTWGEHINLGPTHRSFKRIVKDIHEFHTQTGDQITGLGHSLGGLYHLYLARVYPNIYRQTIGLASPCELRLQDAYTKTNVGTAFTLMDWFKPLYERRLMEHWQPERDLDPITPQRSMLIAGRDGVVDPLSCELPEQDGCMNYYLDTTHGDILSDETALRLVEHLTKNGNQAKLPLSIKKHLIDRDAVQEFRKRDVSFGETINGIGGFVSISATLTSRRAAGTLHSGMNIPLKLLARNNSKTQNMGNIPAIVENGVSGNGVSPLVRPVFNHDAIAAAPSR